MTEWDEAHAGETEWTPERCLDFVTSEGAVRNDAYRDKVFRIRAALATLTREKRIADRALELAVGECMSDTEYYRQQARQELEGS